MVTTCHHSKLAFELENHLKMIGKCLVLLCVVFGIAAGSCLQIPQYGSGVQYELRSSPVAQLVSSPVVQFSGNLYGSENYVSSGAVVASDGPETAPLPVIQAPSVTLPVIEAPMVALPSQPIPAPRVVAQRCVCTKTIVKPQVIQRQVTVPKVQRFLKRTVTPIVENVSYKSRPISSGCSSCQANAYSYSRNGYSRVC